MFKNFKAKISIIWLGYVWLPLAHAFVKEGYEVLGFDIDDSNFLKCNNHKNF